MKITVKTGARARAVSSGALLALMLAACGGGGGGADPAATDPAGTPPPAAGAPPAPPAAPPAGPPASPPASADLIDAAALRACPSASLPIQSIDWPACLAGRRVAGTEVFTGTPCELRVGQGGAFDYVRDGAVFLSVPPRSQWANGIGVYQNTTRDTGGQRVFLTTLDPNFAVAPGQPFLDSIAFSFVAGAAQDESVEVGYFDAQRVRTTLVCRVNVL